MAESRLNYDRLVQDALRGVVREALREVSVRGLPGQHHFYLSFRTDHPDVVMPQYLRAQYPHEMIIVLQHQFWGLEVEESAFSVTLSFNGQHERLTIPLAALGHFEDPSVGFRLPLAAGAARERPMRSGGREARPPVPSPPVAEDGSKSADVVTLDAYRRK